MTITAEQIARKMGISNATVSRVLNNSQNVSPETREAVLSMVRASGGVPRVLGRRTKRSIGRAPVMPSGVVQILMVSRYMIPNVEAELNAPPEERPERVSPTAFFSPQARLATSYSRHIINGIIDELRHYDMRAMVRVCENMDSPSLVSEVNQPGNRGVFLVGGVPGPDILDFVGKCRSPIVTYMTWQHNGWPDYIGIDNFNGIRMAYEHLRQLGHRKIGYVAGHLEPSPVFRERLAAYKICLIDHNEPYHPEWVVECICELKPIEEGASAVLSLKDRPTAFICCYDGGAVAVKRAADKLGLQVPRDLSIVGFDDEDIAQLMTPALTTIRVPTALMGKQGVQVMLLRQQAPIKPGEGFNIRVTPTLIVRQSTAPVAG